MRTLLTSALFFIASTLSANSLLAPDRVYLNVATQHFGLGEEVFGVDGPNQFNPGIGLGWDIGIYDLKYSFGYYKDSFSDPAITFGLSKVLVGNEKWELIGGVATTISLAGSKRVLFEDGYQTVERRLYAWPYFQLEYGHFYTQLRAGVNRDIEPAGVFAFGLKFDIDELF